MKLRTSWVLVAALLLAAHQAATAGLTATIVDSVGNPNSIVLNGAGSFNVNIRVTTTTSLSALQLKLKETTGSGYFTLNTVTFSTPNPTPPPPSGVWSAVPDYQVSPVPPSQTLSGPSYTSGLIGDLADDVDNGTGTGPFDFAALNIAYSGPSSGAYSLNLTEIVYGDMDYNEYAGSAGTTYQVQVIPAPGAAVLGLIGLSIVAWARRLTGPDRAGEDHRA